MKVYELLIDEDDDLSGVQLLSIVKKPANEYTWEIFSDEEKPHDCSTHNFSTEAIDLVDGIGDEIDLNVLLEAEHREFELSPEEFAAPAIKSNPNEVDLGYDNPETKVGVSRYIYVVDTGLGSPLISTSRTMCRKLILAQKVFRRTDINELSNSLEALGEESFKYVFRKRGLGVDTFNYKMGKNDRHCWRELVFYKKPDESFEDLLARIPKNAVMGTKKADAVVAGGTRPFIAEAKIPNGTGQLELFSRQDRLKPMGFHMGLFIYTDKFSCMVNEPEAVYLSKIKISNMEGWVGANVMDSYLEGTGVVVDKFKVKEKFVKVPEYIREVAERAVKYAEENGWGSCGTQVGKKRANDLSKKDYDASLDVLSRMYSYGSRHKVDWESSDGYDDGCGDLMMAAWGLSRTNYDEAMSWLERQLDEATEMSVKFSADEYKGDITAVVFEPDTKIYRYDEETQKPYYVFMSRETIEKLLKKFSRLKESGKIKNIVNYEHSDKIFSADDVFSYENWLVGNNPKEDKSYQIFGREMKPGTWITTLHFKNKDLFEKFVLSNKTAGISLEGLFHEVPFNFFDVSRETFVKPNAGETEDEFISRCMSELDTEFPDQEQRAAVCYSYWGQRFNDYDNDDTEMVEGIIDLLLQVEDMDNREEIAKGIIKDFMEEGISFNYDDFILRLGLTDFGFNFPEGTCWEGYEPIGTKIKDGKEVPNCVPMTKQKMAMLGIYGGAPAFSTESEAEEYAKRLGCSGTHYEEGAGYMPCKTHDEAADLYDSSKLLFTLKTILSVYFNNEK
jgi:hypothetical protein